ncbi:hypothetical protein GCM10027040_10960 [Halomonas shantousis]
MPLRLEGAVTLHVGGEEESLRIEASDFRCEEAGLRMLGEGARHEFLYTFDEPRFGLRLSATAIDGVVELDNVIIEVKGDAQVMEESNTLLASFVHDPDRDDEPLTPISSN